jgi:hypothetical protein
LKNNSIINLNIALQILDEFSVSTHQVGAYPRMTKSIFRFVNDKGEIYDRILSWRKIKLIQINRIESL